jgi:hypothetical protein
VRSLLAQGTGYATCDDRAEAATALAKAQTMARECQLEPEEAIARDLLAKLKLA